MFWAKCGKILTDQSGKVVNCDVSPCGFYTVLGIKYRWLNNDTMQPYNNCTWYYDVQPYQVKAGKITWNYDMCNICINVSQNSGLVAKKKFKSGCWQDCWQHDEETGECTDLYEQCDCVVQVQVYNLAGCFDDYNKFAQFFYSKADISPDENNKYPDIWSDWYGVLYPTSQAYQSIENYWNKYFCDQYMLSYNLIYTNHEQRWWQYIAYHQWISFEYTWTYCSNPDTYESNDNCGDVSCPDGWTKQTYQDYYDYYESVGGFAWQEACDDAFDQTYSLYIKTGGSPVCSAGFYDYIEDCCEYRDSGNTTDETGAFIMNGSNMKDRYCDKGSYTHECRVSNNLCTNWSYSANCWDNYYHDCTNARFYFGWSKVTCQRCDSTPDWATGIKFEVTLIRTKMNTGKGHQSQEKTQQTLELSLMFDQTYQDLPLLDHINTMKVLESPECYDSCQRSKGTWITEPAVNWGDHEQNVLSDKLEVSFVALEYLK